VSLSSPKPRWAAQTIGFGATGALSVNPSLQPNISYDVLRDVAPITMLAGTPFMLLASGAVQGSVAAVLAAVRARPQGFWLGHGGSGTAMHLAAELLNLCAGTRIQLVPCRGWGRAGAATATGGIRLSIDDPPAAPPLMQDRRVRAPAVTSPERETLHARRADPGPASGERRTVRLVRSRRAGAHAGADRRAAERRLHQGAARAGDGRAAPQPWRRAALDHGGGLRDLPARGAGETGRGLARLRRARAEEDPMRHMPTRRTLLAASALAAPPGALRAQQEWPNRPITLIVRLPPGMGRT
jgi:hypothetical protein